MDRLPSNLTLPIMACLFVLIFGGSLGVIFSVTGHIGTMIIGLAIVFVSPIICGILAKR